MSAVAVATLGEALEAAEQGARELENADGTAQTHGFALIDSIAKGVQRQYDHVAFTFHAGDDPALAVCAMHAGYAQVKFSGAAAYDETLQSIATASGARLVR